MICGEIMQISGMSELEKVLELAKKNGVSSFKIKDMEFHFSSSISGAPNYLDETLKAIHKSDTQMPPDDQLLFLSSEGNLMEEPKV